jgi:aspartyl-tRNA(Asn)/glutamyl-tRNA(Gln) amidotransferase subunit B
MEIVTEPDLESAEEAFAYLRSLQMILQQGDVSDADMEKGQLRCDVNISLRKTPADPLGSKVELKNLNSISAIRRAIHFEIDRQTEDLDRGIPQIQSTRRWDDDRGETQLMRTKEDAHDYRYFSCPDLLPIRTAPLLEKVRPLVPELPHELAARFEKDFGVTAYDASVLSSDRHLAAYFEATLDQAIPGKKAANFIINNLLGKLNEAGHRHRRLPGHAGKTPRAAPARRGRHARLQPGQRGVRRSLSEPDKEPRRHRRQPRFQKGRSRRTRSPRRCRHRQQPGRSRSRQGRQRETPQLPHRPGHESRRHQAEPETGHRIAAISLKTRAGRARASGRA